MKISKLSCINKPKHAVNRVMTFDRKRAGTLATFTCAALIAPASLAAQLPNHESEKSSATPESVKYNAGFIHGGEVDVSQFSEGNPVAEGVYPVTVQVNGVSRGRHDIHFLPVTGRKNAEASFTAKELAELGITLNKNNIPDNEKRYTLAELIQESQVYYNSSDLELDIQVPQINQVKYPRGYTDSSRWETGTSAGFLDYNANFYGLSSGPADGKSRHDDYSSNLSLFGGLNIAGWRLRRRTNLNWSKKDQKLHSDNLATYAATDVSTLKSQLIVGDSNTTGKIFDSYNLRGVQLRSDDRMLPEGLRNYSPVIRGVAQSNARVTVTQHGMTVYQTVVTPGPFELTDIGAMGYGGDMQMTITEADGHQQISSIPFSAPPMLLHKDVSSFELSAGELKDDALKEKPKVVQGLLQYGLGNNYTVYGGTQVSDHYHALALGNAINTLLGGFSFDVNRAWSELQSGRSSVGNSYNVGFTKYVSETATNMTLAAYRYSTKGYYSLRDASIERNGRINNDFDIDYRTKERFTASVSQTLWDNSVLNLSGSIYTYWRKESQAKQYAVTWTKSLRYFSYALTAMRTSNEEGKYDNTVMASISIPLGSSINHRPLFSSIYSTASHSNNGNDRFQLNAIGSRGEQNELTYGVGTSAQKMRDNGSQELISGNLNYRSPFGQYGMTGSVDNEGASRQLSFSASGSIVAHKGGVTFGPALGDAPFAIVGAPGAAGSKIFNGQGGSIDRNGYAVMPSLTPYRENSVALDYKTVPDNVDVLESQRTVVPREGAIIAVNMKTIEGRPIVLTLRDEQGHFIPVGSALVDDHGVNQGMTGQGGMAFVRGWDPATGNLFVVSGSMKCRIVPSTNMQNQVNISQKNSVVQMEATCYRK